MFVQRIKHRHVFIMLTHLFSPLMFIVLITVVILRRDVEFNNKSKSVVPGKVDPSKKPVFIAHMNDLHITDMHVDHVAHVWSLFDMIEKQINPSATVVTGDMTDSRLDEGKFSVYGQYEKSWAPYLQILQDHPNMTVYAAAGNHDEISVVSVNHTMHMYQRYINNYNESEFYVSKKYVDTPDGKIKIIIYNPYRFPVPPLPLYLFAYPTADILDMLEEALQPEEGVLFNIVASHYPMQSTFNMQTHDGVTYQDLLSDKYNVRYSLVGHFHLHNGFLHRLNNTIEVIGVFPTIGETKVSIISIDNMISVASIIDFSDEYPFVVSNPPPKSQFSSMNPYVNEDFRVRVPVFSHENITIWCSLDGKPVGTMTQDCEDEKYIVYGIDAHAKPGKHVLQLSGDIHKTVHFAVGQMYPSKIAFGISYYLHLMPIISCIVFVNFFIIWLLIGPPLLDRFFGNYFRAYGAWLHGDEKLHSFQLINVLRSITVGPFYCVWRFHYTSLRTKRWIFFLFVSQFFIPFYFAKTDDGLMTIWFWGYTAKGVVEMDCYCWICEAIFLLVFWYPLWFIAGLALERPRWSIQLSIDFIIFTIPMIAATFLLVSLLSMGGGNFAMLTTPMPLKMLVIGVIVIKEFFGDMPIHQEIMNKLKRRKSE